MNNAVYWIHHSGHTDMMNQGYIGITHNFEHRMNTHKNSKSKSRINSAIKSHGWDNLIKDIIYRGTRIECELYEYLLRSQPHTGWNITVGGGGGRPGVTTSDKQKAAVSKAWKGVKRGPQSILVPR